MPQEQHLLEQLVSWLPVWSQPKHNAPHLKSRKESGRGQTSLEFPMHCSETVPSVSLSPGKRSAIWAVWGLAQVAMMTSFQTGLRFQLKTNNSPENHHQITQGNMSLIFKVSTFLSRET